MQRYIERSAISLILIYPLLFIFQGLDFTDMGYWLTGYQQFLSAPKTMGLACWGSYAIGWLVSESSFGLGVIAFKLALVLINWITLWLVYLLVREHLQERTRYLLAPLLFVTMGYVIKSTEDWIGYNSLTALFFVLTAFFLYRGITRQSQWMLVWAGVSAGFNIFVRIPNLLGIGLIILVFVYGWMSQTPVKKSFLHFVLFIMGVFAAVAFTVGVMLWCGHLGLYCEGLASVIGMAKDSDSHHSSGLLLKLFVRDHYYAFVRGCLIIICGIFAAGVFGTLKRLNLIAAVIIISILAYPISWSGDAWKWTITGATYLVLLIGAVAYSKRNPRLALLCLLAGAVLFIAPLGSNNGIRNAVYGSWLALPVVCVLGIQMLQTHKETLQIGDIRINCSSIMLIMVLGSGMLLLYSLVTKIGYTYRDHSNRLLMTHRVDAPLLKGVRTTEARAKVVSELLQEMAKHVKPGDVILAYDGIPMVHYLTGTVPYLGKPWPMLLMPEETRLRLQRNANQSLPTIIVRATGNTSDFSWPMGARELLNTERHIGNRHAFREFELQYGYFLAWGNDYFEILTRNNASVAPL
jgi:hypothetical protein